MNIEAMAKKAGFSLNNGSKWINVTGTDDNLRRFARLVAEACIEECEREHVGDDINDDCDNDGDKAYNQALRDAIDSIKGVCK